MKDFDNIFHFKVAQNLVAEHYDRDFEIIFLFKRLNTLLQSTMREILT